MSVCRYTVAAQTEEVRGSRTQTPEPSPAGGGDKPHTPQPVIRLSDASPQPNPNKHSQHPNTGLCWNGKSFSLLRWSRAENEDDCFDIHQAVNWARTPCSPHQHHSSMFQSTYTQTLITNNTQIKNHQTKPIQIRAATKTDFHYIIIVSKQNHNNDIVLSTEISKVIVINKWIKFILFCVFSFLAHEFWSVPIISV